MIFCLLFIVLELFGLLSKTAFCLVVAVKQHQLFSGLHTN